VRVLIVHNRYREAGGEERSVAGIASLLRDRGHFVETVERSSAALAGARGRARAGAAMVAGGLDPGAVARAVERSGADVVHAHNVNPLLGRRALEAARDAGAAVVMHLHNYRLFCAIGIGYRDGEVCRRCRGRNTLPGVRLRCRGGLGEAAAYGAGLAIHQRRLIRSVDRFVVPGRFAARRLEELGLHGFRMEVLPNFVSEGEFAEGPSEGPAEHALFAGRLVEEKGVDTAIEAAARAEVPLAVAGDGPDSGRLRELAKRLDAPVRFLGRLEAGELARARRAAAFAVAPSRWDEPCPYSVIEAMAAGLPVLASDHGGLPEMVGDEASLPARSVERWAEEMALLWRDPVVRLRRATAAHARARALFAEDRFYGGLVSVYESARARRSRGSQEEDEA
jgi:glycosyltransferase involved in cell wall biosynthesis